MNLKTLSDSSGISFIDHEAIADYAMTDTGDVSQANADAIVACCRDLGIPLKVAQIIQENENVLPLVEVDDWGFAVLLSLAPNNLRHHFSVYGTVISLNKRYFLMLRFY